MQWVKCADRLPLMMDTVIFFDPTVEGGKGLTVGWLESDVSIGEDPLFYSCEWREAYYDVEYWMALPEAPK